MIERWRAPWKALTRRLRLALYHWRKGPGFDYHGIRIELPDHIPFGMCRQLMQGRYEEPERRLVEKFMDPVLPVIEIGGSLGVLSSFIGSRLTPRTPFLVVEANSRIIGTCLTNARAGRGPCGLLTVINAALAYGTREIAFPVSDQIHANRIGADGPDMRVVPAKTLAQLREQLGEPGPFTLIMDVEGYEFEAFENDQGALASCSLAIVETHPGVFEAQGKTLDQFLDLVFSQGFEVLARDGTSYAFGRAFVEESELR